MHGRHEALHSEDGTTCCFLLKNYSKRLNSLKLQVDHVTQRVQFGQTLQEFFNVQVGDLTSHQSLPSTDLNFLRFQEKLTNMVARHYATESIVYLLAANMDRGVQDYQLEAALAKVVASVGRSHSSVQQQSTQHMARSDDIDPWRVLIDNGVCRTKYRSLLICPCYIIVVLLRSFIERIYSKSKNFE